MLELRGLRGKSSGQGAADAASASTPRRAEFERCTGAPVGAARGAVAPAARAARGARPATRCATKSRRCSAAIGGRAVQPAAHARPSSTLFEPAARARSTTPRGAGRRDARDAAAPSFAQLNTEFGFALSRSPRRRRWSASPTSST
ncbi:MAG: hypothetical protein MZW92_62905 [Comamonadaceae bacterium]|nr:hypothetical protein [Comamonadaceae bacterium]